MSGLKARMAVAIALLFGLLFAVLMGICYYFGFFAGWLLLIPIGLTCAIILAQWAFAPILLGIIYEIRWRGLEEFDSDIATFIVTTCDKRNIRIPKLGIIEDGNPNAFCFGWTRNKSHLVITRGVLRYCDKEESKAVIGHELGHIAHNDFVVMTLIAAVPLILYVTARGLWHSLRYGSVSSGKGKGGGYVTMAVVAVMVVSYLAYILSQLIALLVNRYREYWADSFSAENTHNPNALASALVKIAYGLAIEGKGDKSDKFHSRYENALMIFNAKAARALATNAASATKGVVSTDNIKRAMAWDLWNPWALMLEFQMTHPLPAKRIRALGELAEAQGQQPYITFDLKKPECYWDDFLCNIFARYSALLAIPVGLLFWIHTHNPSFAVGGALITTGLCLFLYWRFYRYPKQFKEETVNNLIADPKANPVKGKPVRMKGRIIGRGQPGLFYSEDMKLDDGSGLILLDYRQIHPGIDFLVGLFGTEQWLGEEVLVEGWYRRQVVPYIDLYRMTVRDRVRRVWTPDLKEFFGIVLVLIGVMMVVFLTFI